MLMKLREKSSRRKEHIRQLRSELNKDEMQVNEHQTIVRYDMGWYRTILSTFIQMDNTDTLRGQDARVPVLSPC
jgi:hypothetical protein